MIHIFSVHLTIYRSAKSQPSSLRLKLIVCSISDFSTLEKPFSSNLTTHKHANTRQSHRSFWPDIQGKLKKYLKQTLSYTYLFEMDTVEKEVLL